MSPVEKAIVQRKLAIIVRNIQALEKVAQVPEERYGRELLTRKAAERLLQELVEAAIDINTHIIAESGEELPDTYYGSFMALGRLAVLPLDLSLNLAPSAGLRNRLVHEYDSIDDSIVYASIAQAISLYTDYVGAIQAFLIKS